MTPQRWDDNQEIPDNMPLLDKYFSDYRKNNDQPLKGVTFLLIQHQLGNQVPQAEALLKLGASPENIYWLDVPYTASPEVRNHLIHKTGLLEKNFIINDYKVLSPYAAYQRKRTIDQLKAFYKNNVQKLVVLDDGAYFIEAMSCCKDKLKNVAVVEQTTRGLIKIDSNAAFKKCASEIPLINVAESATKKSLEPPFIGYAVCSALHKKLKEKGMSPEGKKCLVNGLGAIGCKVAESLVDAGFDQNNIYVYDTKPESLQSEEVKKYKIWDKSLSEKFHLVVGCSGRSSFGIGDYVYIEDNAILASASSGSVELSREDFIELADTHPNDDIYLKKESIDLNNIHSDLEFRLVDSDAVFVNGGFPVNFTGKVNCVPSHYIQPTVVMMVEAAVKAAQSTMKGRFKLEDTFTNWITEAFKKELGVEADLIK